MQNNIQNEITEEVRLKEMKEVIHKKIDTVTAVGIVADLYASVIGCKDCPFMWTCHKKVPCSKSVINYIRKGEIL